MKEPIDNKPTYLVRICMYNIGFKFPEGSDFSLDEISKKTVKQVLLSRPHSFQDVVFPCPMTVLATEGPFCKVYIINKYQPYKLNLIQLLSSRD